MSTDIFHRIATGGKNQDLHTALEQVSSGEMWGGVSVYGNLYPTVRAFWGPLPDGSDGVEFSTSVPPSRGTSNRREAYWKLHEDSPQVQSSEDGDFARIKATIRLVRYSSGTSVKPRCEWKPS